LPCIAPASLQLNIGLYCNQACAHCHVDSSPKRKVARNATQRNARCCARHAATQRVALQHSAVHTRCDRR
jgi:hypothetical protein